MELNDKVSVVEVTPVWAGTLSIADVDSALKAAGLPEELLPRQPSRATCMKRAFDHCAPRGARIDPLPKGMGVAMSLKDVSKLDLEALTAQAGGVVREAASYHSTLTAKILVENINGTEIETLTFTPDDHPMVPLVRETYRAMRDQYKASDDLSVWFSQTIIPASRGVPKRSRGGGYYVARPNADVILQAAKGLEAVSSYDEIPREVNGVSCPVTRLTVGGKLCLEPRYADDSAAMDVLINGVINDADGALDELAGALQPSDDGKKLGKRGLKSKREEALSMERQIKSWEQVCSVNLDFLRNRLEEIQAGIGMAELALEMEEANDGNG